MKEKNAIEALLSMKRKIVQEKPTGNPEGSYQYCDFKIFNSLKTNSFGFNGVNYHFYIIFPFVLDVKLLYYWFESNSKS